MYLLFFSLFDTFFLLGQCQYFYSVSPSFFVRNIQYFFLIIFISFSILLFPHGFLFGYSLSFFMPHYFTMYLLIGFIRLLASVIVRVGILRFIYLIFLLLVDNSLPSDLCAFLTRSNNLYYSSNYSSVFLEHITCSVTVYRSLSIIFNVIFPLLL